MDFCAAAMSEKEEKKLYTCTYNRYTNNKKGIVMTGFVCVDEGDVGGWQAPDSARLQQLRTKAMTVDDRCLSSKTHLQSKKRLCHTQLNATLSYTIKNLLYEIIRCTRESFVQKYNCAKSYSTGLSKQVFGYFRRIINAWDGVSPCHCRVSK
jgi:hypothetical protein